MFYYKRTVIKFCPNCKQEVLISVHKYDDDTLSVGGFYAAINQWNREASLQLKNGVKVGQNIYNYCWITPEEYNNFKQDFSHVALSIIC